MKIKVILQNGQFIESESVLLLECETDAIPKSEYNFVGLPDTQIAGITYEVRKGKLWCVSIDPLYPEPLIPSGSSTLKPGDPA